MRVPIPAVFVSAERSPTTEPDVRMGRCRRGAFTLIELMIVLSLIATLAAGVGLALGGRGGDGAALNNAQSILAGLVGHARAQAALYQTKSRLLVYASQPPAADAGKYLRYLQVVREEPFGSGAWVATGPAVTLPAPICIVPPTVPANHRATGVNWTGTLALGPVSSLADPVNINVVGQSTLLNGNQVGIAQVFGGTGGGQAYYLEFSADGTVTGKGTNLKLAVSTAILAPNSFPLFNNPNAVRGLLLRRTGGVSFVNDANSF